MTKREQEVAEGVTKAAFKTLIDSFEQIIDFAPKGADFDEMWVNTKNELIKKLDAQNTSPI